MLRALIEGLGSLRAHQEEAERRYRHAIAERCVARILGRMAPAVRPYLSPAEREFLEGSHAGRH